MGEEAHQSEPLHVAFIPYLAPGHTIPMLDTVLLLASRQVRTTVITTPFNAPNVAKHLNVALGSPNNDGDQFSPNIHIIPFPSHELTGLPEGLENQASITTHELCQTFIMAMDLFEGPVQEFLEKTKINCLVSDLFFTFTTRLAKSFGIPRIAFQVHGCFTMCLMTGLHKHDPQKSVSAEDEPFVIPGLPDEITLTKSQLQRELSSTAWGQFMRRAAIGYITSYGDIYNTFYELEPDYADYCRNDLPNKKVWHIGPLSLCNRRNSQDKSERGGQSASISKDECLRWLDSKPPSSVVYLSFGTLTHFKSSQLKEIAIALENAGHNFVWVVRARDTGNETQDEDWLPQGFEKRVEGRGLIIRGWAPQVMILEHQSLGAFVTHCGWNSCLEGFLAGVPMATWPLHSEQFFSEKLITDALKTGVQIGSKHWSVTGDGTFINHEKIEVALKVIMGEEALEMRSRAKKVKELAYNAVKPGGSSDRALTSLIQELTSYSP